MPNNSHKIQRMYDSVAKEYAQTFLRDHEKKPKDREILLRFSNQIGDKKSIWDFGCGPGQTTRYLHDLGIDISGLDLSEKILDQAKTFHPGINFIRGNILDLKCDDNSINAVVAFYAIVHFTDKLAEQALREIFRVLQPDGLFLFTYHIGEDSIHIEEFLGKKVDIDFRFFDSDYICGCLKTIGFIDIEIIEREPYPDVEYPSRRAYVFAKKPRL